MTPFGIPYVMFNIRGGKKKPCKQGRYIHSYRMLQPGGQPLAPLRGRLTRAGRTDIANRKCWCYIYPMVKLELRSSHWVVDQNNNIIFGKGRMEILESITQTGSINQTAKVLKMSYKTVWSKIKSTEKHLQIKVVHSDKKSGTRLTSEGRKLVEMFKRLRRRCLSADDAVFATIFPADKRH